MTNLSPTPVRTLERAREVALQRGVRYAYVGNVPGHQYEHTFCHQCGEKLIGRYGYRVLEVHISEGKCAFCGTAIPGVWQ
jgi:pyruvate formate lyase activating enzyme